MSRVSLTFPDGAVREYPAGITAVGVAAVCAVSVRLLPGVGVIVPSPDTVPTTRPAPPSVAPARTSMPLAATSVASVSVLVPPSCAGPCDTTVPTCALVSVMPVEPPRVQTACVQGPA